MTASTVCYKNGARFDEAYYVATHLPCVALATCSSNQLDHYAPSNHRRRSLQARKRDVALLAEQR
jgi:hypothetical protein